MRLALDRAIAAAQRRLGGISRRQLNGLLARGILRIQITETSRTQRRRLAEHRPAVPADLARPVRWCAIGHHWMTRVGQATTCPACRDEKRQRRVRAARRASTLRTQAARARWRKERA